MTLETAFALVLGVPVAALFVSPFVEKKLANYPHWRTVWGYGFRASWGLAAWLLLTLFTALGLQKLFPSQNLYLLSGSYITALPALMWGALICWVCLGRGTASGPNVPRETFEQRIDALLGGAGKLLKYAGCATLVGVAAIAAYIIAQLVKSRISELSNGEAIVGGAFIVAAAIYFGLRQRN